MAVLDDAQKKTEEDDAQRCVEFAVEKAKNAAVLTRSLGR